MVRRWRSAWLFCLTAASMTLYAGVRVTTEQEDRRQHAQMARQASWEDGGGVPAAAEESGPGKVNICTEYFANGTIRCDSAFKQILP